MKNILLFMALLIAAVNASGQKKLIKRLLSNDIDTTRKSSFMPIPVLGYSQETGAQFGLGGLFATFMDRKDTTNRSSNFSLLSSVSTKKQYYVSLRGDIYTSKNKFHLIGDLTFKRTPFNFYGIGNKTRHANEIKLLEDQFKILLEGEKSFIPNTYTGVSMGFENYKYTDRTPGGIFTSNPDIRGKRGGNVFYIGVSQSYDTRNSNNYPTKGLFARLTYQFAPTFLTSTDLNISQIKLTVSNFWTLANHLVLGVNGFYNTVQSSKTPFYLLPQLGNDEMMRGYYRGRFRDENLITVQSELRYRFTNRFGLVAFAGAGRVFSNGDFSLKYFKPTYGGGARYFFDPAKGLSVRLDYGVGEKPPGEKRQSGFYISLAEAF